MSFRTCWYLTSAMKAKASKRPCPITTLSAGNLDTYEINESLTGDYLWVNTNIGEAFPDVMTPLTWTAIRDLDEEMTIIPGFYILSGNICGRAYTNIRFSMQTKFGVDAKRFIETNRDLFGQTPEGMSIPIYPFSDWDPIKVLVPRMLRILKKFRKASKNQQQYLKSTPNWCKGMTERIQHVNMCYNVLRGGDH